MKFLITGGSSIMNNLGDQAMIFTLIESIRTYCPDADIVLFDEEACKNGNLKYTFRILPDIPMNAKLKIFNKFLYFLYKLTNIRNRFDKELEKSILNEYQTCDHIFQLPGFGISSQMSFNNCISRVWDIAVAKKLGKRIIMLPQSIGPLDFKGLKKIIVNHYIKKYINYPDKVFCREKMGRDLLDELGCTKTKIEHDLVLSRPEDIDPNKIYKSEPSRAPKYDIDSQRDILIVPNSRLQKYRSDSEIRKIFYRIIKECINITGGKAYIFNHALKDDGDICNLIYSDFTDNPSVIIVNGGFNCMQTEKFLKRFAIGIVCRWHSNVHAIRAGLPYVVIGWAEKYHETARYFNNSELIFDIREPILENNIIAAAERVYNNRNEIAGKINDTENEIKKTFCLDNIMKDIMEETC